MKNFKNVSARHPEAIKEQVVVWGEGLRVLTMSLTVGTKIIAPDSEKRFHGTISSDFLALLSLWDTLLELV